jgi:hypothetical protein
VDAGGGGEVRVEHKWHCPNCDTRRSAVLQHDSDSPIFVMGYCCEKQFIIGCAVISKVKVCEWVPIEKKEE